MHVQRILVTITEPHPPEVCGLGGCTEWLNKRQKKKTPERNHGLCSSPILWIRTPIVAETKGDMLEIRASVAGSVSIAAQYNQFFWKSLHNYSFCAISILLQSYLSSEAIHHAYFGCCIDNSMLDCRNNGEYGKWWNNLVEREIRMTKL